MGRAGRHIPRWARLIAIGAIAVIGVAVIGVDGLLADVDPNQDEVTTIELPAEQVALLRAAPTRMEVYGGTVRLGGYAWRNLMPTFGPDGNGVTTGRGLTAHVAVELVDDRPNRRRAKRQGGRRSFVKDGPPAAERVKPLEITHVWVIQGTGTWSVHRSGLSGSHRGHDEVAAVTARGGPSWPCEASLCIVACVRDAAGTLHLLRAENQKVECAY